MTQQLQELETGCFIGAPGALSFCPGHALWSYPFQKLTSQTCQVSLISVMLPLITLALPLPGSGVHGTTQARLSFQPFLPPIRVAAK